MRAAVCTAYGPPEDVLELRDVPTPEPDDDQVLIRVVTTTVQAGDYRIRGLNVPRGFGTVTRLAMGFRGPRKRVLGTEAAGVVETVGRNVVGFSPGDAVMAYVGAGLGAHAEYMVVPADGRVVPKPENVGWEEAAAAGFGGLTALHFLRNKAAVRPGEKVLVYGASGAVGTAAVQVAKYLGADVTGVCSTKNLNRVRALGADRVLDYTMDLLPPAGEIHDVVMETVGKTPFSLWKPALREGGAYLMVSGGLPDMLAGVWHGLTSRRRIISGISADSTEDYATVRALLESGAYRPVIDRSFPFDQIAAAHRYAESGHKVGNVVVRVAP